MFIFGCLLAFTAAFAPRIVLIFAWIFSPKWNQVFDNWFLPLLGIIFLPYTTIMYLLAYSPGVGISGWDWMWIILGLILDFWKWSAIIQSRRTSPGSQMQGSPPPPKYIETADTETIDYDEFEKLVRLHDQGELSDKEFEAQRKELLNQ